jgi:ent-kaurene oxidase
MVGNRCVNEDDLPKLKYLEAIVKETLRKHLPVPLLPPRHVDEDTTLGGYNIRKGWQVSSIKYRLRQNELYRACSSYHSK